MQSVIAGQDNKRRIEANKSRARLHGAEGALTQSSQLDDIANDLNTRGKCIASDFQQASGVAETFALFDRLVKVADGIAESHPFLKVGWSLVILAYKVSDFVQTLNADLT